MPVAGSRLGGKKATGIAGRRRDSAQGLRGLHSFDAVQ
jgi:hypothetical protein